MSTTTNPSSGEQIADSFIQAVKSKGEGGQFLTYKFLQDLFQEFAGTQTMEMLTREGREEWLYRFQVISDTIFELETLAAADKANNIDASGQVPEQ